MTVMGTSQFAGGWIALSLPAWLPDRPAQFLSGTSEQG